METTSLYTRLGGYDAIAAITDELLARLRNDPQLGGFWKGHSENSLRRDRQLVVNYMCEAAGGPVFYTGRDMQTSHKGLGISSSDWAVFMQHAAAALEKFAVPAPERDEVLAFLSSLQGDVVERA
jgi:hemoglobin